MIAGVLALTLTVHAIAEESVDPGNDGSQYAHGANLGWLNAEPQGHGGPGLRIVSNQVSGWIWSANTGWISLSCANTGSCNTVEYRISYQGGNELAGWAWSPNIGWISFSCANTSSCGTVDYGVTVDTGTGELSGFAYAANAGWISFNCAATGSCATVGYLVRIDPDDLSVGVIFFDGFES